MEIKDCIHYYLGCEVEYEGIINGKELKARKQIEKVIGKKTGFLKRIDQLVDGTRRYRIGRRGLQTHYNTLRFKLILRRLSSITEQEKEQAFLSRGAGDGCGQNNVADAHEFHYLLSCGFWLFGDEAFEKGLIIEKK